MSADTARGAIILCAFVVAGVYFWRRVSGPTAESNLTLGSLVGAKGPMVSPEGFVVAWGAVFLLLSMLSSFAPSLAGSLAVLILLTDLIANFASASSTAIALEQGQRAPEPATPLARGKGGGAGFGSLLSNLFPGAKYSVGRTDAGKDFSNISGNIGALAPGEIVAVQQLSGFGTTIFERLAHPMGGRRYVYYALENGARRLSAPRMVSAGTPLARGTGGVIEVGPASAPNVGGIEQGGKQESGGTPAGLGFATLLGL